MAAAGLIGVIKSATGDAILSFGWIFCSSALGAVTTALSSAFGVDSGDGLSKLLILTALFAVLIVVFDVIATALGGASFNPAGNVTMYAAGVPGDTLFSMAIRFPAQVVGSLGGAIAILQVMPSQYKHTLVGPSIKVDLHTAAMAEGMLTFLINLVVLIIIRRIRGGILISTCLLAISTVTLIVSGSDFTGPSMNPANAYAWAYVNNWHNTWEQFYVYWICPFIGALMAAWLFRIVFSDSKKQKRVPKKKKRN